jgi:hypothetical protein
MALQPRHRWMAECVASTFDKVDVFAVEEGFRDVSNFKKLSDFLEAKTK